MKNNQEKTTDEIKFLGTAGARFVMIKQLRSSAGIFLNLENTKVLIDPGPCTLARFAASKPKIDPTKLNAIILTHKHLDHSNDVNVMIEAMTDGGFKKRGVLMCPGDALSESKEPVVLNRYRKLLEREEIFKEGYSYTVGNLEINTPKQHLHPVETYGLNISAKNRKIKLSFIADTLYFDGLEKFYTADILILNVAMYKRREGVDHLCVEDAEKIIKASLPKVAIITHFGMTMLRNKPWEIAKKMTEKTGVKVIAASDGMKFNLEQFI